MTLIESISSAIAAATGQPFAAEGRHSVGGGCINATEVFEGGGRKFFVKLNDAARLDMFAAEAEGLREIAATHTVRVPQPVCHGCHGGQAWLVLEYLDLRSSGESADESLGRALAAMHRA
ncbi:MAG: fructosamine kinase family protein, partial [Gammaproteobacteria bacterium]|nr:fructosamine kinase family protein [Gammaproteobacteria bacterium]